MILTVTVLMSLNFVLLFSLVMAVRSLRHELKQELRESEMKIENYLEENKKWEY